MDFIRLTNEERKEVLSSLDDQEKASMSLAESILQKIAGVYINRVGYHPEMADLYRNVAGTLSELKVEINNE